MDIATVGEQIKSWAGLISLAISLGIGIAIQVTNGAKVIQREADSLSKKTYIRNSLPGRTFYT